MARPSVKAERTEEILDAFERCVARFGVEGTSLERIAEESGLKRSLLRYYIGNRDELVEALADRFIEKAEGLTDIMIDELPETNPAQGIIDNFFNSPRDEDSTILVADALITCSGSYPRVKEKLKGWYDRFVSRSCDVIQSSYPGVSHDRCWMVSVAIISIYFNVDAMDPLGLSSRYREASIEAAQLLLNSLAD
jgi:AcrR family transcriptional regulator